MTSATKSLGEDMSSLKLRNEASLSENANRSADGEESLQNESGAESGLGSEDPASPENEPGLLLQGFEFDAEDFETKSERRNQGLAGGHRSVRCNGGRGREVKICISSEVLGLSSSESDTDEEFLDYFKSQMLSGVGNSKSPSRPFVDFPYYVARHKARKQARRDGYDEKEKARRRAAKDEIKAQKAAAMKLLEGGVPCEPGKTVYELFLKDFIEGFYDEKTLAAARLASGIEVPLLMSTRPIPASERRAGKSFGNRLLVNEADVFQRNAWDNVEWGEEQKQEAVQKVDTNSKVLVDETVKENLESNAAQCWDKFYDIHQNKFFRDRRWLFNEFPELLGPYGHGVNPLESAAGVKDRRRNESFPGENSKFRILEIGCGNGSTVFPVLLDSNHPDTYVYCCDFSPSAVDVVRTSPKLDPLRCTPFVWDITEVNPQLPFPPESIDVVTLIFVLSAISPEKFTNAAQNILKCLKPGGVLLFRDYGLYDLVQLRQPMGRCISENFYFRGDGTRVYFFEEDEVQNLFTSNGMEKLTLFVDRRLQVNRLRELKMYRIWIQGKFRKPDPAAAAAVPDVGPIFNGTVDPAASAAANEL